MFKTHSISIRCKWGLLMGVALVCSACGPKPDTVPLSDPSVASLGKAGTALIVNNISANVMVPNVSFNIPAIEAMILQVANPTMTRDEMVNATWTKLFENPADYLTTTDVEPVTQTTVARGSGFFVTSDGVLVTNAHVVEASDDDLKKAFATKGLTDNLVDKIRGMLSGLGADDEKLAADWMSNDANAKLAGDAIVAFLAPRVQVTDEKADIGVVDVSGESGTLEKPQLLPAHPLPGGVGSSKDEDVAVLKVDGAGFHTLPLENDAPQVEESVFAVGFPGSSTFSSAFDQKERPESTVTDGKVNAIKALSNNAYAAIQMSATIHPGNSGGPVLDRFGRVVGISTFYVADSDGHEISGNNFALPTSVVKRYLSLAGVTPAESDTTLHYRRSLQLEQTNHFVKARNELEAVLKDRPTDVIAQRDLERVRKEIDDGQDKSYMDYLPTAGGAGLACVLMAFGGVAVVRKRRLTSGAAAASPVVTSARPAPAAGRAYRLLVQGKMVPLIVGATLTTSDLPFLQSSGGEVVATVVRKSSEPGTVGLRNDSADSWEAIKPDGSSQVVSPSEVVQVTPGLRLSFGAAQGVVHG